MTKSKRLSAGKSYLVALVAWAVAVGLSLRLGAIPNATFEIIRELRLPRALLASAVGMGLSVAGVALQSLFANPLCEPYTLGISSGSALGAVIGISLGWNWIIAGVAGPAVVGALAFALVLFWISRKTQAGNLTLLLAGVMLQFFGASIVAVWMALADVQGIQGAIFWLLGDLSRARLAGSIVVFSLSLILSYSLWRKWRALDALLMGEEGAQSLGVEVGAARRSVIFLSSLLVGLCVSAAGMIGFIGLVIPHFARRQVGSLHLKLVPLAAIWGAVALTLADTAARFLVSPYELPVGAVTALIGAPLFLVIMLRRQEYHE